MATQKVTRFHADGDPVKGMEPTEFVDPDTVTEGTVEEMGTMFFTNARETLMGGVWECKPMTERIDSYPFDEFMQVLSGSVTITDKDGHAETFKAGDSMMMPQGFAGTWEITETLRKYYVILT